MRQIQQAIISFIPVAKNGFMEVSSDERNQDISPRFADAFVFLF